MRKSLVFFLIAIGTCLSLRASHTDDRVKLPDFAYPQDAIKTAQALIKSRSADERVLGALELLTAKSADNFLSIPPTMKLIERLADETEDPASKSLLKLLAAQTGYSFFWNDSLYTCYFDYTLPKSQAKSELYLIRDSLLKEALAIAPPTPITDFHSAIEITDIGKEIMPTVRDFVAWHVVYPTDLLNPKKDLIDPVIQATDADSPVHRALKGKFMLPKQEDEQFSFILDMLDSRASDYALYQFIKGQKPRSELSDIQIQQQMKFLRQAKQKVSGSWVEETVDKRIELLETPYYKVEFPSKVYSFQPLTLNLTGYNVDSLTLDLYKFKSENEALQAWKSGEKINEKPYLTKVFNFNKTYSGDTRSEKFDVDAGHYLIQIDGIDNAEPGYRNPLFSVFPWSVLCLGYSRSDESVIIQALDSRTSQPISGLQVVVEEDGEVTTLDLYTDKNGAVRVPNISSKYNVGLKDCVTGNIFDNRLPIEATGINDDHNDDENESIFYDFTSNFRIYQPGDTAEMVLVVSNDEQTLKGKTINTTVSFPSNHSQQGAKIPVKFGPTDAYGRATAKVKIPDNSLLGSAFVIKTEGNHYIGSLTISDRLTYHDIKMKIVNKELTADSIIMTVQTLDLDGVGMAGVKVTGTAQYTLSDRDSIEAIAIDATTDDFGTIRLSVPRYSSVEKTDDDDENLVEISLDAIAPDSRTAYLCETIDMDYPFENPYITSIDRRFSEHNNKDKTYFNKNEDITFDVKTEKNNSPEEIIWTLTNSDDKSMTKSGIGRVGVCVIPSSQLDSLSPGYYTLSVKYPDGQSRTDAYPFDLFLFDPEVPEVPRERPFVIADPLIEGDVANLTIGIAEDNTTIWIDATLVDDPEGQPKHLYSYKLNRGWHQIPIEIGRLPKGRSAIKPEVYTLNSRYNLEWNDFCVVQPPSDTLSLTLESFRDYLIPGTRETWTFITKRNGKPVEAALLLNLVDVKLTEIDYSKTFRLRPYRSLGPILEKGHKDKNPGFSDFKLNTYNPKLSGLVNSTLVTMPDWHNLFGDDLKWKKEESFFDTMRHIAIRSCRAPNGFGITDGRIVPPSNLLTIGSPADSNAESQELLSALWKPMLTTDKKGRATITFDVPDKPMRWFLWAEAWTKDLLTANISRYFNSSKPVTVISQLPETVRNGELTELTSTVTNTTTKAMEVTVKVKVELGKRGLVDTKTEINLAPGEIRNITTPVSVSNNGDQLRYTVSASSNDFSDGERHAIPVSRDF